MDVLQRLGEVGQVGRRSVGHLQGLASDPNSASPQPSEPAGVAERQRQSTEVEAGRAKHAGHLVGAEVAKPGHRERRLFRWASVGPNRSQDAWALYLRSASVLVCRYALRGSLRLQHRSRALAHRSGGRVTESLFEPRTLVANRRALAISLYPMGQALGRPLQPG